MRTWIKWAIGGLIIASIAGFIGWRIMAGNLEKPARTVTAEYQTITKDITFSGAATAKQSADLAFELTGALQNMYANVGDTVIKGQRLALLNAESVQLELAKAQADKASSSSLEYISWQKAVEDLKNTKEENAKITEQKRQTVRDAKKAWDQSKEVHSAKADESGDDSSLARAAYSTVLANESAYKAAQKALETSLKSTEKSNDASQKAADLAYAQYTNTLQASISNAGISSLGALEELAKLKSSKSILRAPFAGVITKRSLEVGELASAGAPVLTLETVSDIIITADVPETDALATGLSADITFDAMQSAGTISTTIESIDPSATIIQGVPTFKVTLSSSNALPELRPGITANITVHVAKKDHVLGVPRRAIITKQGEEFVKIQKQDKTEEERKVTTGLVGSDGIVEVVSGLSEGEIVITS